MKKADASEKLFRQTLQAEILGANVFASPQQILSGVKEENYGKEVPKLPYTLWQLLEHLRIAQNEILMYIEGKENAPRKWPSEYWPEEKSPKNKKEWQKSVEAFLKDQKKVIGLIKHSPLLDQIPFQTEGHTFLREFSLIALHNSYHLGQFVALRRLLNDWT